jgi:hypothetical protein
MVKIEEYPPFGPEIEDGNKNLKFVIINVGTRYGMIESAEIFARYANKSTGSWPIFGQRITQGSLPVVLKPGEMILFSVNANIDNAIKSEPPYPIMLGVSIHTINSKAQQFNRQIVFGEMLDKVQETDIEFTEPAALFQND